MRAACPRRTLRLGLPVLLALSAAVPAGAQSAPAAVRLDVPYVHAGHVKQRVDLYLPRGTGWPTLVFVHGGSLRVGDRKGDSIPGLCRRLAADGVACVSVGYRLFSDGVTWPAPAEDVAAAYMWTVNAVAERGGDPRRVFIGGHSSGCVLASVVGGGGYLARHGLRAADVPGIVAMGCRLALPFDTVGRAHEEIEAAFREEEGYGSLEARLDAAPINHVGPDLPLVLVLIADAERINPPIEADARRYREVARAAGRDVVRIEILPDRRHYTALHRMAETEDPTRRLVVDFVREGGRDR